MPTPGRRTLVALAVTTLLSIIIVPTARAATPAPAVNPQQNSVGLSGAVPGPAPNQPASITSPVNGTHTGTLPITIAGTCPNSTYVSIEKNGVFAGITPCQSGGSFSLPVDLFIGQNTLVARVSDSLGQYGPDSTPVTVFYDAPSFSVSSTGTGRQLFLQTDTYIVGIAPGQEISRGVTIVGGVGPYAISWDWGDGSTSLSAQSAEGSVTDRHTYKQPGTYLVIVRVTDSKGNSAFLQLLTVVNGPIQPLGSARTGFISGNLISLWPLLLAVMFLVFIFWLGGRWKEYRLRRRGRLID